MTLPRHGSSSNADHDFSSERPQTTEDYEFNQPGKSTKAIIGLGILVAFGLAMAFIHPANHGASSTSPMVNDSAQHTNNMNHAPGQTTGQTSTAPSNSTN